jgi:ABC-type multidrug transport system fused ATPase/permease subunit
MLYVLLAVMVISAFWLSLSNFMRNDAPRATLVPVLMMYATVVAAFITLGWKLGLLFLLLCLLPALFRPVGARVSESLRSRSGSDHPGDRSGSISRESLAAISRRMSSLDRISEKNFERDVMDSNKRAKRAAAREALLDYCMRDPAINVVLAEYSLDRADLEKMHYWLCVQGVSQWAGRHWVPAAAIAYPEPLRFLAAKFAGSEDPGFKTALQIVAYFEHGIPLAI